MSGAGKIADLAKSIFVWRTSKPVIEKEKDDKAASDVKDIQNAIKDGDTSKMAEFLKSQKEITKQQEELKQQ